MPFIGICWVRSTCSSQEVWGGVNYAWTAQAVSAFVGALQYRNMWTVLVPFWVVWMKACLHRKFIFGYGEWYNYLCTSSLKCRCWCGYLLQFSLQAILDTSNGVQGIVQFSQDTRTPCNLKLYLCTLLSLKQEYYYWQILTVKVVDSAMTKFTSVLA